MQYRIDLKLAMSAALVGGLLLNGCGGGGGGDSEGTVNGVQFTSNSPQAIAQESAENYGDNVNGVITATTLKNWIANWEANRPSGITGKLIILQASAGPAGAEYIKPNGTNVFTYLSPSSEWIQTRSNGVIETQSMVPSGSQMDGLMKKFNIDPTKDMIVAAMGTGSNPNAMAQGRIWYALRYWGVDKTHLAVLNGGNQWLNGNELMASDFTDTPSTAPDTGTFTVKSLTMDNTQLQATVGDVLRVLPSSDTNIKTDGVMVWDARSMSQFSAGEMAEKGEDVDPDATGTQACATAYCARTNVNNYMNTFQNGGSRQGHPWGTLQLQYTNMLDASKGYSYKPKAELAAYLTGAADANGIGFVDGGYGLVGAGNAYQNGDTIIVYCETTFRAMITGIVSSVILGKPTRFYDGAMVEWNSLSYIMDKDGKFILPSDSPWRTDVKSFFRPAISSTLVNTRTITNAYSSSTNAIIDEDKSYKTGESVPSSGGGSGGGLPGNPCGG